MVLINKEHKYFSGVAVFSILALSLNMVALKLVYYSIGLLLEANGAAVERKKEITIQVDNLKRYSNYCTNLFYLVSCLFLIFIGIILITKKIKLKMYLCTYLLFELIQIIGLWLFIHIFNKYGLTEGFARWRILHRNGLFWIMLIIPIIICLLNRKQKA